MVGSGESLVSQVAVCAGAQGGAHDRGCEYRGCSCSGGAVDFSRAFLFRHRIKGGQRCTDTLLLLAHCMRLLRTPPCGYEDLCSQYWWTDHPSEGSSKGWIRTLKVRRHQGANTSLENYWIWTTEKMEAPGSGLSVMDALLLGVFPSLQEAVQRVMGGPDGLAEGRDRACHRVWTRRPALTSGWCPRSFAPGSRARQGGE